MQNDQWNFDISEMTISSESSSSFSTATPVNTGSVVVSPQPPLERITQQQVEDTATDLFSDVDNFTELQSLVKSVSVEGEEGGESNKCDRESDEVDKIEEKEENNELVLLPGGEFEGGIEEKWCELFVLSDRRRIFI